MTAETLAAPEPFVGSTAPHLWNRAGRGDSRRSAFGDAAVLLFLLAQCFDGVFTYVGVAAFGIGIEANPIIATVMSTFGHGAGLTGAKAVAAALGICLHLREVHGAVAALTGFYVAVAIVPWTVVLFF